MVRRGVYRFAQLPQTISMCNPVTFEPATHERF
jgi:hypothetical protein